MAKETTFDSRFWQSIHESLFDYILILDHDLNVTFINRAEKGLSKEDVLGQPLYKLVEKKDLSRVKGLLASVLKSGKAVNYETTYQRPDNSIVYFESIASPIRDNEEISGLTVISRDISERKQVAEKLQKSNEQIESLMASSSAMVYRCKPNANFPVTFISENIRHVLGYEPDEFLRVPDFWADHLHPDDRPRVFADIKSLFTNGYHSHEYRFLHKDGTYRWMLDKLKLVCDQAEKPTDIIGSWIDITIHKQAEEKLKDALKETEEEKRKSEAIIDSLGEAVSIQDTDFKILFQNKAHRDLIGEHLGRYCYQAYEKKDKICDDCPINKSFKDGKVHIAQRSAETDQGKLHVEITASPLKDSDGKIIAGIEVVEDIGMRLQMEKEVRKLQNLESLGVLAGGIAHDFNNMLMGIMGNISLAKMHAGTEGKIFNFLSESEKACERATGLTQQLLTFARGGAPIKLLCSIEDLIRDSISFILSGSDIKAEYIFEGSLPPVKIDQGQMSQVFQNIVKNARQAMPKGGKIKIHAKGTNVSKDSPGLKKGRYIKIDIIDSGIGISAKDLHRVFDPYFSTRQSGTGLGLTVAHSIVQGHNGRISVSSEPGCGSCFSLWIPASSEAFAAEHDKEQAPQQKGEGKILVMDDDDSVRSVVVNMLERIGYETDTAEEGRAAIELYSTAMKKSRPFDVVICDLTVPGGMGGAETVKEILRIDPTAKVIVASGYANDPIMADFSKYGFSGFIPKPYMIDELRKLLHGLIQGDDKD